MVINSQKNYSLYIKCNNNEVEIYNGSLEEIDDFTSHFESKDAIKRLIVDKEDFSYLDVYVKSKLSNEKKYNILFYSNRSVLDVNNYKDIINLLLEVDKSKIDKFLYEVLNLEKCLKSDNSNNIPIVKLHNCIINKNYAEYHNIMYRYLSSHYNTLRQMVTYFFKSDELKNCRYKVPMSKKSEIINIMGSVKEIINKIDDIQVSENNNIDDFAHSIISNDTLTEEEKINELYMLYNSMDEVNNILKDRKIS